MKAGEGRRRLWARAKGQGTDSNVEGSWRCRGSLDFPQRTAVGLEWEPREVKDQCVTSTCH